MGDAEDGDYSKNKEKGGDAGGSDGIRDLAKEGSEQIQSLLLFRKPTDGYLNVLVLLVKFVQTLSH